MSALLVPLWVRIVVGTLAAANIYFAVLGYLSTKPLFDNGTAGIDMAGSGAKFASWEFAARNLSIGLVLLLAAVLGMPAAVVIIVSVKILIELQSIIIGLAAHNLGAGPIVSVVFLAVEVAVVITVLVQ